MNQEELKEELRFYSLTSISLATFLGGPIAASVLLRRNFLNVNEDRKALNALFIGVLSTILLFVIIFSIPESFWEKFPNSIIPGIYTGIIYLIADKYQGQKLKEHKDNNGNFYSAWKATGIGLLFSLIIVAGIFGYVFASETQYDFDAKLYDEKIEQFLENETTSLAVFSKIGNLEEGKLINEFGKGKVLWEENHRIADEILLIENLPSELSDIAEKLKRYSSLRIASYDLFIKAISEQTDKYGNEIEEINMDIEKILTVLN